MLRIVWAVFVPILLLLFALVCDCFGSTPGAPMAWRVGGVICTDNSDEPICTGLPQSPRSIKVDSVSKLSSPFKPGDALRVDNNGLLVRSAPAGPARSIHTPDLIAPRMSDMVYVQPTITLDTSTTQVVHLSTDGQKLEVWFKEMKYIFRVAAGRIVLESVGVK